MKLKDRIALVTGGSSGIGRGVAIAFAREGAEVVVNYPTPDQQANALSVCDEIARLGRHAIAVQADVAIEFDARKLCAAANDRFGRIDILVNNAGVNAYFNAESMTEAEWEGVFAVDLKGAWLCAKHVLTGMKERRCGSIVNIASIHASSTMAGMFPYAAAKSGLDLDEGRGALPRLEAPEEPRLLDLRAAVFGAEHVAVAAVVAEAVEDGDLVGLLDRAGFVPHDAPPAVDL